MKWLILCACLFSFATAHAEAIKGMNYDPEHFTEFFESLKSKLPLESVIEIVNNDLYIIQKEGYNTIKTVYTNNLYIIDDERDYEAKNDIVHLVCRRGMNIVLGVDVSDPKYGFRIQDAINAANYDPKCVKRIFISNSHKKNTDHDIALITSGLEIIKGKLAKIGKRYPEIANIPVGPFIDSKTLLELSPDDKEKLMQTSDFIGINLKLYDSGLSVEEAVRTFEQSIQKVKSVVGSKHIIIDEGWPSKGEYPTASNEALATYYKWWKERDDNLESYYNTMFDKIDLHENPDGTINNTADLYYGLYDSKGEKKN